MDESPSPPSSGRLPASFACLVMTYRASSIDEASSMRPSLSCRPVRCELMHTVPAFLVTVLCVACVTPGDVPDAVQRDALAPTPCASSGVYRAVPRPLCATLPGKITVSDRIWAPRTRSPSRRTLPSIEFQADMPRCSTQSRPGMLTSLSATPRPPGKGRQLTQAVLSIELDYLRTEWVSASLNGGSGSRSVRIGVTQGSTSQTTLPKYLTLASRRARCQRRSLPRKAPRGVSSKRSRPTSDPVRTRRWHTWLDRACR